MRYTLGSVALLLGAAVVHAQQPLYAQCGGVGWTGNTTCVAGSYCAASSAYYSQCLPGTDPTPVATTPAVPQSTPPPSAGTVSMGGINIAGFDFSCQIDGTCDIQGAYPPLPQFYGPNGPGQMQHFVNDDKLNVFRLPVAWQYMVNNVLGGPLNETNAGIYDILVQDCLATGASCIIDIHNYARWNGLIINQSPGGPTDAQFASLWSQIAAKYANESKIIFGVMNEPHDIPDITIWATSVQAAVTAIRQAGATTQIILLPGNNWTSAETFVSNGSGPALLGVTNPDGSTTNLVFDVHKYLDSDNSGTAPECVTNNIDTAFGPLAQWLRANGRVAFNTETGGGNTASCATFLCEQLQFVNQNSDVYLGFVGWAAGSFDPGYVLSETPVENGTVWTDSSLVAACIVPNGPNA